MKTKHKIALVRIVRAPIVLVRRLFGLGQMPVVTRAGLRWRLDLNEGIDFSIYFLRCYEFTTARAIRRLVGSGSTVLDIGANIGAHTLSFAQLVGPGGRVYAFEPTEFAYAKLMRNLDLNPEIAGRVTANQMMLVDRPDSEPPKHLYASWPLETKERVHPKHLGRALATDHATATTLDSYVERENLQKVDFIKLDVDGYECQVLRGARKTLERFRPVILSELAPYHLAEAGESVEELVSILESSNYVLLNLAGKRFLSSDADRLRSLVPEGTSKNVIAWPRERPL
ncbi:MAG: FkbM family methyltransferase [Proteobacteria bacterium]|nr:FkbM family methyltransferase [Pseudomonadota bacterium]